MHFPVFPTSIYLNSAYVAIRIGDIVYAIDIYMQYMVRMCINVKQCTHYWLLTLQIAGKLSNGMSMFEVDFGK